MKYDVCIIGGGAAGLAAAASFHKYASGSETRICILEKNDSLGRKILATGGGRCNLTNAECENRRIVLDFFKDLGIETICDDEGRFFPYTNRASDVVSALKSTIGDNADIRCGFTVKVVSRIRAEDMNGFMITGQAGSAGNTEMIFADNVILSMGGKAAPQYGTTGDGYGIAKALGHTVTRVYPILTGIECEKNGVDFSGLKGIRARGRVTLNKDGRAAASETGEIQFTENGISGICVFNLTPYIKAEEGENAREAMKRFTVSVDLAPDFTQEETAGRESTFGILTAPLSEVVGIKDIKNWTLRVDGVRGWRDAQATSGGIPLDEINMDTMESVIVPGMYFAGEIIDVQGPCGGFNLQNAWETGIKAAMGIAGKK